LTSAETLEPVDAGAAQWADFFQRSQQRVERGSALEVRGTLTRLAGLVLEASGLRAPVGSQCIVTSGQREAVLAEVVGFSNDRAFLMPAGDVHGLSSGASVAPAPSYVPVPSLHGASAADFALDTGMLRLPLGDGLLGRVVDSQGLPLGLQLIGRPFDEETLFSLGEVIEQAAGRFTPARWW